MNTTRIGTDSQLAGPCFQHKEEGALPFSRSWREGESFGGWPAIATLVDLVFPGFVHPRENLHGQSSRLHAFGIEEIAENW